MRGDWIYRCTSTGQAVQVQPGYQDTPIPKRDRKRKFLTTATNRGRRQDSMTPEEVNAAMRTWKR